MQVPVVVGTKIWEEKLEPVWGNNNVKDHIKGDQKQYRPTGHPDPYDHLNNDDYMG